MIQSICNSARSVISYALNSRPVQAIVKNRYTAINAVLLGCCISSAIQCRESEDPLKSLLAGATATVSAALILGVTKLQENSMQADRSLIQAQNDLIQAQGTRTASQERIITGHHDLMATMAGLSASQNAHIANRELVIAEQRDRINAQTDAIGMLLQIPRQLVIFNINIWG